MPPARTLESSTDCEKIASDLTIALGGLQYLLGYNLRRAQDAMHRDFLETLSELDITQKQAAALMLTSANPGASQIQLANKLDMDRATMTAILDRLEAGGLLQRKRSKTDRRRQQLYLTPKGEKTLIAMNAKIDEHEKRFRKRFSNAELAKLNASLRRIYEG